jgi:biotin-dependent carboxylase-like uncharacterized protein
VTEAVVVERAGLACLTDFGRAGRAHLGVSVNGAADRYSARTANVLVGNADGAPLIEVTGSALGVRARQPLLVAATGAVDRVRLDGFAAPVAEPLVVPAGCRIDLDPAEQGFRSYLAVNGLLGAAPVLGSVAPDPLLGIGQLLSTGAVICLESRFTGLDHPFSRVPLFRLDAPVTALGGGDVEVDVTPGPDVAEFGDGPGRLLAGSFTVTPQSDHIGLRLTGPVPRRTVGSEILSRGVPVGAVEVPPGAGLIVLLRGRFTTAGYPLLAVVTAQSVDRLGQVRPGSTIRFRTRTVEEAVSALRAAERRLDALAGRVGTAFTATGLGAVLADQHRGHRTDTSAVGHPPAGR